jgi:hypothetical protein
MHGTPVPDEAFIFQKGDKFGVEFLRIRLEEIVRR